MFKLITLLSCLLLLLGINQFEMIYQAAPYPLTTGCIFLLGIALWFFNIMPAPITGIILMILFSVFDILTFEEAVSGLGEPVIWLVVSVLFLGAAVENINLDQRIAYKTLSLFGKNEKNIVFIFILLGYFLTFLIPNSMARLSMLLPISQSVIGEIQTKDKENFCKVLILSITFVPYITTVAIMTGASGSIYAVGLFEASLDYQWSYLYWLLVITPITLSSLLVLWIALFFWFPIKNTDTTKIYIFKEKLNEMGKATIKEKKLTIIYIILITGWITSQWHHFSISLISLIAMVVLFLPGVDIIKWEEARKKVDWGIPLLFAAGLSIALAFESGGVIDLVAQYIVYPMENVKPFLLSLCIMVVIVFIRIGFTNFNSMVASTMPIILTLGTVSDVNPIWLGMIYLIASSTSFLIPTQAIGSMTTYSLGYYSSQDYLKVGFPLTIAIVMVTLFAAFYYWPYIGLSIYE